MYIGNVFLATISVPLRALRNYEALQLVHKPSASGKLSLQSWLFVIETGRYLPPTLHFSRPVYLWIFIYLYSCAFKIEHVLIYDAL